MSKKRNNTAPVPPGNKPRFGNNNKTTEKPTKAPAEGAPLSEQDPKRRLGNFQTAGEHSIEQPDGKQGPNH